MSEIPHLLHALEQPAAARHVAHLYESEEELAASASRFIAEGLHRGEAVLVIATAAHWALFVARLATDTAIDLAGAIVSGQLRIMDANLAVSAVVVDGLPQWHRVNESASSIIENSLRRFGALRVYGEMVDLLWERGNRVGAAMLETHWNALAHQYPIDRLCVYRTNAAEKGAHNALLRCVCRTHSRILPRTGYPGTDAQDDSDDSDDGPGIESMAA